jgi:non-heme chloroperoxidase
MATLKETTGPLLAILSLLLIACSDSNDHLPKKNISYQQYYEPVESSIEIRSLESSDQTTLYYIDEGDPQGIPVLLVTGSGTSVTAALLTTHLNTLRDQLSIRLISVQRNGFGQSMYQEGWGYQDYVNDVETVLEALNIDEFHISAISGGGPYTGFLAESLGDRLLSLHLAATITGNNSINGQSTLSGTLGTVCAIAGTETPVEKIKGLLSGFALNSSEQWWGFAENNPMLAVEGFEAAAAVDWEYTFLSRTTDEALTAVASELLRFCTIPIPDLSNVIAPVFIYHGDEDTSASLNNVDVWAKSLVNAYSTKIRLYPGEGHWVQYTPWQASMLISWKL